MTAKTDTTAQVAENLKKGLEEKTTNKALSGAAVAILNLLRDKGKTGAGMTVLDIQEELGIDNDRKARKGIREACNAAVHNGDLCYTITGGASRASKTYWVVPEDTAKALGNPLIQEIKNKATDFAFGGDKDGRFNKSK